MLLCPSSQTFATMEPGHGAVSVWMTTQFGEAPFAWEREALPGRPYRRDRVPANRTRPTLAWPILCGLGTSGSGSTAEIQMRRRARVCDFRTGIARVVSKAYKTKVGEWEEYSTRQAVLHDDQL